MLFRSFSTAAEAGFAAVDLPDFEFLGVLVLAVTVCAMARTSSRLKAMGLAAVLRFRMLSRRADFLDGFSMEGERGADLAAADG